MTVKLQRVDERLAIVVHAEAPDKVMNRLNKGSSAIVAYVHSRSHAVLAATASRTRAMARYNWTPDRRSIASQAPSAAQRIAHDLEGDAGDSKRTHAGQPPVRLGAAAAGQPMGATVRWPALRAWSSILMIGTRWPEHPFAAAHERQHDRTPHCFRWRIDQDSLVHVVGLAQPPSGRPISNCIVE
ncbi:hypothetical protein [Thiocapsa sp.]|uniref:hypothetical protein n=1 Tax=Thiocapsa sp. TaxID=2024551 RepID=UPI00359367F2